MSKQYYVESKTGSGGSRTDAATTTTAKVAYINDHPFEIQEGDTILALMRRHFGKDAIPILCYAPNLDPFGACRVCSVDVALSKGE